MTKGTPSMGKKSGKKLHLYCRRCGYKAYHMKTGVCAKCGYGYSKKLRKYSWQKRNKRPIMRKNLRHVKSFV